MRALAHEVAALGQILLPNGETPTRNGWGSVGVGGGPGTGRR
jgi:hypothetical protein